MQPFSRTLLLLLLAFLNLTVLSHHASPPPPPPPQTPLFMCILSAAIATSQINGQDTLGMTHEQVLQLIGSSDEVHLAVKREPDALLLLLQEARGWACAGRL